VDGGPITISQVAKQAGVSTATVSRVLSGSAVVNQEMADRVRKAVDELGYQPNGAARGLASGSHQTIALVVPDLGNQYFNDVIKVVNSLARRDGQRIVVADSEGDPATEMDIVNGLSAQVDGIILLSSRLSIANLKILAGRKLPVVLVNRVEFGVDLPVVAADNFSAVLELCAHLTALGHRRVAYLAGSPLAWQNRERWRAMSQASVLGIDAFMVQADATIDAGYAACDDALRMNPTALVCFNDLAAVGALSRLHELGMSVPDEISVTGFDDTDLSRFVRPSLTTMTSPKGALGEQAWKLLRENAESTPEEPVMITTKLVIRASTGPAPQRATLNDQNTESLEA
jgi:LacI family transcriptional regulator